MAIQNSDAKIFQAGKSLGRSLDLFGRYAREIEEGRLYTRLMELGSRLTEAPVTSDLEPIFKIEKEIGTKVAKFTRTKSETAALGRFQRASDQLLRFADKMEDGSALLERMEAASKLDLTKVADLQPIFVLCDEVFAAVGAFQNGEIVRKIDRVLKGWLTAKTGEVGRYAEAFKGTDAYLKALAWKANKPLANADYRAFKDWRNTGYELLKSALEAPWGYFQCEGHGEVLVKVMPIHPKGGGKWFIPSECHTCHTAGQSSTGKKGKGSADWQTMSDKAYCPPKEDRSSWDSAELATFMSEVAEKRANKFNLAKKHKAKEEKPEPAEIPMADLAPAVLSPREIAENVLSAQIATGTAPKPNVQAVGPVKVRKSGGKKTKTPGKFQGQQAPEDEELKVKKATKTKTKKHEGLGS